MQRGEKSLRGCLLNIGHLGCTQNNRDPKPEQTKSAPDPTNAVPMRFRERFLHPGSAITRTGSCVGHASEWNAGLSNTRRVRCLAESVFALSREARCRDKKVCAVVQSLRHLAECRAMANGLRLQIANEEPHEYFSEKF